MLDDGNVDACKVISSHTETRLMVGGVLNRAELIVCLVHTQESIICGLKNDIFACPFVRVCVYIGFVQNIHKHDVPI